MTQSIRRFEGRVAVVTGGAKGIGHATAVALAGEGATVAVLDVENPANPSSSLHYINCDVANPLSVNEAFAQVRSRTEGISRTRGIDLLVNNAGIQTYGSVTETDDALWDRTIGVNLKGAFLCARAAIPSMLERSGGVVINVSSVQAFVTQQKVAAYTTAKTALLGLTRSIAVDYGPRIRCVAVCPGTVDTPMLRDAIKQSPDPKAVLQECIDMHPLQRIATPAEIAELILFLCSDAAGFITGQYVRIDGGLGLSIAGSKRS